jgi:hypothetical protein
MTIIQKHVRPGAIREALGEDLHTAVAALVTLPRSVARRPIAWPLCAGCGMRWCPRSRPSPRRK